jgi:hypothetical protein
VGGEAIAADWEISKICLVKMRVVFLGIFSVLGESLSLADDGEG